MLVLVAEVSSSITTVYGHQSMRICYNLMRLVVEPAISDYRADKRSNVVSQMIDIVSN